MVIVAKNEVLKLFSLKMNVKKVKNNIDKYKYNGNLNKKFDGKIIIEKI